MSSNPSFPPFYVILAYFPIFPLKQSINSLFQLLYIRCGAGTNNIPVPRMTELGIPVFNTPGANANAVKELVLCGMLLGSRRVVDGINHMKDLGSQGLARERVEKDKAMFGGQELKGKTLAVIGLGKLVTAIIIVDPSMTHTSFGTEILTVFPFV